MSQNQINQDDDKVETSRCSSDDVESASFLPQTSKPMKRSNSSMKMLKAVKEAVWVTKSTSSTPLSESPVTTKRSSSLVTVPDSRKTFFTKTTSKSIKDDSVTAAEDQAEGEMCKISDGPNWVFMLAVRGNVKELSEICNANPDRLLSRDRKGATVLHHAAGARRTPVVDFVISFTRGLELLNEFDDLNSTPLHWAVNSDSGATVTALIKKGADPAVKNKTGYPALHLAVQVNSLQALQALIDCKVNLNERGTGFVTALHVAAFQDNDRAFKMLLDAGAKPGMACAQGYYPLHAAASAGSRKCMELLLNRCGQYGYTREKLLSYGSKEKASPLHSAVIGGNIEAIKICLEFGARLDVKQADDSTPMHMVCAQGNLEIVRLMFELAPEQAHASMFMLDKQDHAPLHKAAMFNHPMIIRYLVEQGADTEVVDTDERTPLLLAASRECFKSVRVLIELGANLLVKDKDARNLMHVVILRGGDITRLSEDKDMQKACESVFQKCDVQTLLSQHDASGCSPLHYACQEGNLASLKILMHLGVSARSKSCKQQSPLHFASMYGRFNACRRLLSCEQGPSIINEKDEAGMTPIHFAAQEGHVKVVQLLLNRGAILHRNISGHTPLHVAAASGYTKTIRTLIETHPQLVDLIEENGNTALHIAATAGHVAAVELLLDLNASFIRNNEGSTCFTEAITNQNRDVTLAIVQHNRWEEAMNAFQQSGDNILMPILLLIQHLPDVCLVLLNRCKEVVDVDARSLNYWVKYHFKYLQPPAEKRDALKKRFKELHKKHKAEGVADKDDSMYVFMKNLESANLALPALNKMVEFNRVECLRHPVSVAYLRQKWRAYGRLIHFINFIFYLLSLFPITYIVCSIGTGNHTEHGASIYKDINGTLVKDPPAQYSNFQIVMMYQVAIINVLQIMKELVQIFQQKWIYFMDFTNLVEWTLYVTSVLFVVPFITGYPVHWQFEVGSVAIFLAWFNLLVFLQKFDLAGIYVVMFLQIFQTLIQVILVFSFLIIAFAFAFYLLMQNEQDHAFRDPLLAMMRTTTMMLGEISYVEKFLQPLVDGDPNTFHFPIPTLILLLIFILMVPILLINLLIGLAVGDIAAVQSNAVLQRLAMQVQLHTSIESRLPTAFLRRVDKLSVVFYPNRCQSLFKRIWTSVFKYTGVQDDYGDGGEGLTDPNIEYLQVEMQKQKQRLKTIQTTLDKQHDLLRLIVQKMEIRSEAENQDEGTAPMRGPTSRQLPLSPSMGANLMAIRALKSAK